MQPFMQQALAAVQNERQEARLRALLTCAQQDAGEDGAGDRGDGGAGDVLLGEVQVIAAAGRAQRRLAGGRGVLAGAGQGGRWEELLPAGSRRRPGPRLLPPHEARAACPAPSLGGSPDDGHHGRGGEGGEEGDHEGHPVEVEAQVVRALEAPDLEHLGPAGRKEGGRREGQARGSAAKDRMPRQSAQGATEQGLARCEGTGQTLALIGQEGRGRRGRAGQGCCWAAAVAARSLVLTVHWYGEARHVLV